MIDKVKGITPYCWFCNKQLDGVEITISNIAGSVDCEDCHVHYLWETDDDSDDWVVTVMNFRLRKDLVFYIQFETTVDDYFQKASAGINYLQQGMTYRSILTFTDIFKFLSMPLPKLKDKLKLLLVFS